MGHFFLHKYEYAEKVKMISDKGNAGYSTKNQY